MDDVAAGERRRKADAFASASFPVLTPRGPGPLPSPSGSSLLPSPPPPAAAATVLALPASAAASPAASPATVLAGAMDPHLLVRRSKPQKRPASQAEARESGGGGKFLALWRDYDDLLQETENKKRRLERVNQRKLRLLAEVKFLRRRYKLLMKCKQTQHSLKGQAAQIQSHVGFNEASAFDDHVAGTGVPSSSKNPSQGAGAGVPSSSRNTNQDSALNDRRFDLLGHQGPPKLGKFDQDGADEDMVTTNVKFSVRNRDTGNCPSTDDKRTIAWQDHYILQA